MIEERRERIRNQVRVKTCGRFILLAKFSNYSEVEEIDPEIDLQHKEDLITAPCRTCGKIDKLCDNQCYDCTMWYEG